MISTAMRIEADIAQRARASGDVLAARDAVDASEAHARDGLSLRMGGTSGAGIWNGRAEAAIALVDPEMRRAQEERTTRLPGADAVVAIKALGVPHLQVYAEWRYAEALAQSGQSNEELSSAIREGIMQATGVNEPVRLVLVALARDQGVVDG